MKISSKQLAAAHKISLQNFTGLLLNPDANNNQRKRIVEARDGEKGKRVAI